MICVRLSRIKFIILTLLILILYNEWVAFYLKIRTWPKLPIMSNIDSLRILMVADPQILSVMTEPSFPLSYIAVWDANRFVSRSFLWTLEFSQPDIVVFMGDLINDGSVSSSEIFLELVSRFQDLFQTSNIKNIMYIPGDNDIGGEGLDLFSSEKLQRFNSAFKSENPMSCKFAQLYHVNIIPGVKEQLPVMKNISKFESNETFRIIFSHVPLTAGATHSTQEKINKIVPSIIFSAHDHESYELVGRKDVPKAKQFILLRDEDIVKIDLNSKELYEISIPTCSYRMGKKRYGYGLAQISKSGLLQYTVLWLPSRFRQLWMYFWGLVISISLLTYPFILHLSNIFAKTKLYSKYHTV